MKHVVLFNKKDKNKPVKGQILTDEHGNKLKVHKVTKRRTKKKISYIQCPSGQLIKQDKSSWQFKALCKKIKDPVEYVRSL